MTRMLYVAIGLALAGLLHEAHIHQSGRDLDISLYEGTFMTRGTWVPNLDRFRGQNNPDAVLFFAAGGDFGDVLFSEIVAGV